jgi:hypothetical protein
LHRWTLGQPVSGLGVSQAHGSCSVLTRAGSQMDRYRASSSPNGPMVHIWRDSSLTRSACPAGPIGVR